MTGAYLGRSSGHTSDLTGHRGRSDPACFGGRPHPGVGHRCCSHRLAGLGRSYPIGGPDPGVGSPDPAGRASCLATAGFVRAPTIAGPTAAIRGFAGFDNEAVVTTCTRTDHAG